MLTWAAVLTCVSIPLLSEEHDRWRRYPPPKSSVKTGVGVGSQRHCKPYRSKRELYNQRFVFVFLAVRPLQLAMALENVVRDGEPFLRTKGVVISCTLVVRHP